MKTPAVTQCTKTILILFMLLLAVGDNLAAQSRTKDRVRRRTHRIFAAQTGPDQVTLAWDEVPGATEYRIYLPDPDKPGPPEPGSRPTMSFSGSGRRATVMGVQRMTGGAYLEALGQGEVLYRGTFNAVARAPLARPTAPAAVQARETGETEVTLSWNPVPGATAYMIGRAAGGSGLQMLCDICPPSGEFVDTNATPGLEHSYTVAAIFPLGISTRTPSNRLTVGAAQLAAAAASAPPAAAWDKPMSSGTPVAGTAADNSNVGASAGTPTTGTTTTGTPTTTTGTPTTTTGTPTGTTTTGTGTGTPTGGTPGGMPAANTQTSNNPGSWLPGGVSGASVNVTNPFTPGGTPAAAMPGQSTTATTQPTTAFPPTPVTTTPTTTSSTATTATTVHAATPVGTPCKLDYQRADNMWAAFGHPDGSLGTETISLFAGQTKAFITDWKYEKTRNDGSNYYGSHLRIATNSGSGTIQLQIRVMELTLADFRVRDVGIGIAPGSSTQFQADLIAVSCGK